MRCAEELARIGSSAPATAATWTRNQYQRAPVLTGRSIRVIYAYPSDGVDRGAEVAPRISADVDEIAAWFRRAHPDSTDTMARQDHTFMAAPIEAMEVFLTEVDAEHGSIEGYFSSIGVEADMIDAFRAAVIQPERIPSG